MSQSLAEALNSSDCKVTLGKIPCAEEVFRLYQSKDVEGMRAFVRAYQDYWTGRNSSIAGFEEGLRQGALRNLDEASYIADLIAEGNAPFDALKKTARELTGIPQHLWKVGDSRRFYHGTIGYEVPFGAVGFHTVLDNSVYVMDVRDAGFGDRGSASVWLLMNRFVLSEDTAISYLKDKIGELGRLVKEIVDRRISEVSEVQFSASNVLFKGEISGITDLERAILLLPDEIKEKIAEGYEDCIGEIRNKIIVPKEPGDYISVRLGVFPKKFIDELKPKVRDSKWYGATLNFFSLQGAPAWGEVVPFGQIADHDPDVEMEGVPLSLRWEIHQAIKSAYVFFLDHDNFARLIPDQAVVPEQLLVEPLKFLHLKHKKQDSEKHKNSTVN